MPTNMYSAEFKADAVALYESEAPEKHRAFCVSRTTR